MSLFLIPFLFSNRIASKRYQSNPLGLMNRELAAPLARRLGLGPRQQRRLLIFFGSLVTARYSFLIIDAVDRLRATSPEGSFSAGHEQLSRYCMVWMLGLLAMLLPVMLRNSPRLMGMAAMAINFLLLTLLYEHN